MHYKRVCSDLQQVEGTISMALRSNIDSKTGKRALEEVFNLVQQAAERCLLAQAKPIRETFSQGMNIG